MVQDFTLNKTHIRLLLLWIVSLLYYNTIECYLVIDRLRHLEIIRYPIMNLKLAFFIYPLVAFFACCYRRNASKIIYYFFLVVLCIFYSFIIFSENINEFPIKTWIIFIFFIGSIFLGVFLNNKIERTALCELSSKQNKNDIMSFFLYVLIIGVIIVTTFCHSYIV